MKLFRIACVSQVNNSVNVPNDGEESEKVELNVYSFRTILQLGALPSSNIAKLVKSRIAIDFSMAFVSDHMQKVPIYHEVVSWLTATGVNRWKFCRTHRT